MEVDEVDSMAAVAATVILSGLTFGGLLSPVPLLPRPRSNLWATAAPLWRVTAVWPPTLLLQPPLAPDGTTEANDDVPWIGPRRDLTDGETTSG